jgi:hypothetical protein
MHAFERENNFKDKVGGVMVQIIVLPPIRGAK